MSNLTTVKSVRIAILFSAILLFLTLRNSAMGWYLTPKPRYIFVDLGANGADSFEAFLQNPGSKFAYDYPRPPWAKHEDAEVYLFEANPVFNEALVRSKEKYTAKGMKVHIFPSTVADIEDGIRTFYIDTVNKDHDFWGSSIYAEHHDAKASNAKGTRLTSVNLALWLLKNFTPRDFVVVKMDIEGAEYELVPHLAQMKAGIVIDHLLVEWHYFDVGGSPEEKALREEKARLGSAMLVNDGTIMPHYDSAA